MNSKPHVKRRRLSRRGFAITDAYRAIQCNSMALSTLT
jgi:hypothetical protein